MSLNLLKNDIFVTTANIEKNCVVYKFLNQFLESIFPPADEKNIENRWYEEKG